MVLTAPSDAPPRRPAPASPAKRLRNAVEEVFGARELTGNLVRRDLKVREAIRHQTPLLTRYPNTEAAQDVEAIAKRLVAETS